MSNWAEEQAAFMRACGQTVGEVNNSQTALYADLVREEASETLRAWHRYDFGLDLVGAVPHGLAAELADGAIDTIYVCLGLLHSMGIDPQAAWAEVQRSNMAKIDPATGEVRKRADGKTLKPDGWIPPDMERVVRESWGL